jgi:hypothetical protein
MHTMHNDEDKFSTYTKISNKLYETYIKSKQYFLDYIMGQDSIVS